MQRIGDGLGPMICEGRRLHCETFPEIISLIILQIISNLFRARGRLLFRTIAPASNSVWQAGGPKTNNSCRTTSTFNCSRPHLQNNMRRDSAPRQPTLYRGRNHPQTDIKNSPGQPYCHFLGPGQILSSVFASDRSKEGHLTGFGMKHAFISTIRAIMISHLVLSI
jgi:hypothetical protein